MAAATLTKRSSGIQGDLRYVMADSLVFANNGDTWVTGLRTIKEINLTPTTNTAFGFTVSGGTLTLVAGAGLTFCGGVRGR